MSDWEEVTDPNEMRKVLGAKGMGNLTFSDGQEGVGTNEAKTREAQFIAGPQRRALVRDLAKAAWLNNRIPSGRFNARVQGAQQEFPPSWQKTGAVQNFQTMLGLQQAMTKPIVTLTSVAPSSKEFDAVREAEMAQTMIPGPTKERGTNIDFINRAGRAALDQEAYSRASDIWRARFKSVHNKSKTGMTFQQFWSDYMRSPAYKKTVLTPFTKLIQGAPKKAGGWKVERED